jgi:hypothetical protein
VGLGAVHVVVEAADALVIGATAITGSKMVSPSNVLPLSCTFQDDAQSQCI